MLIHLLSSQITVKGKVTDKKDNLPIAGASIISDEVATITSDNGQYEILLSKPAKIKFSYLGYSDKVIEIIESVTLNLELEETSAILETTTITASRFEQKLNQSTVSVDIIKPNLLQSTNTIKSDDILNKIPGVQVVGGQANIRGGSGFSYGAGSRVMLLLDELPALQVDAGYTNWGDLPVELLGQMEIIKGASSSLYGSSALNGILHFRREEPSVKPKTSVFTSATYFMDPRLEEYKTWEDRTPYRINLGFAHLAMKNRWSYSIHGFGTKLNSYADSTYEQRGRIGLNLKYQLSPKSVIGVNTLGNHLDNSDFFIWRNALRGAYEPFSGTVSKGIRTRINIDPYFKYYADNGFTHKIFTRYFYTNNDNNANQQNQSSTYYGEYQLSKVVDKYDLTYILGILAGRTNSTAELLSDTTFKYINTSAYAQVDKKFFDHLTLSAGIRFENNVQYSPDSFKTIKIPGGKITDNEMIYRIGINYSLMEYSSIRASWGQGYRFPTTTERFISTTFGGFFIFPNPELRPEYGWSSEIGIKQGFKLSGFKGFLDIAGFISEYDDMIEFTFLENPYGFKPINIGNTRITGYEVSVIGQFNIFDVPVNILSGYTYLNPIYKNLQNNPDLINNLSTDQNVLKYRTKHALKLDMEATYKVVSLGLAMQKYSNMINIDKRFEEPVGGIDLFAIKAFRDQNNDGYTLLDLRMSFNFQKFKTSITVNNIKNIAYTVRPGLLEAPRNASLRFDIQL